MNTKQIKLSIATKQPLTLEMIEFIKNDNSENWSSIVFWKTQSSDKIQNNYYWNIYKEFFKI